MASQFKEFKVKVTVDTKDGNKQIEKTINNLEEYEKILDDLNKKKVKPGITPQELAAIDKEIVELGNAFGKAGNKILLVNQDLEVTTKNLKALQKEQKTFAVGSDEYRKAADKIADFKDKLEGAKRTQISLGEQLEAAPGPLGMFFSGVDKIKNSFTTLGGAIKASGVGLLVSIIGGITAAFAGNEKATKKLQPLLIGMEKIFNGLYRVFEPLLNAFMDMANEALPYIMKGIGMFYSGLVALFTLLKEAGTGVGKILKGIFTLDYDAISEGYEQLTGSWNKAVTQFKDSFKAYEKGTEEVTKTEKKNAEDRDAIRQKELDRAKEKIDAQIELEKNKFNTNEQLLRDFLIARDELDNKKWALENKGAKISQEVLDKQKAAREQFIKDALKEDKEAIQAEIDAQNAKFDKLLDDKKAYNDGIIALEEERLKQIEVLLGKESDAYKTQQLAIWKLKQKGIEDEMNALMAKAESGDMLSKEEWDRYDKLKLAALQLSTTILQANKDTTISDKQKVEERKALQQEIDDFEIEQSGTTFERKMELVKAQGEQEQTDIQAKKDQKKKDLEEGKINQQAYDDSIKQFDFDATKSKKENADKQKAIEDAKFNHQMGQAQKYADAIGALSSLVGKDTVAGKALGISQALINTYVGASQALKQPFPFNIVALATTIATGLKTVREITAVKIPDADVPEVRIRKAMGGILQGPTHASGGIQTNMGELEGGEYVTNRASTQMFRPLLETINTLGGGQRDYQYGGFTGNLPGFGNNTQPIFKTYVVASDMSSQQEMDRVIKDRSKI